MNVVAIALSLAAAHFGPAPCGQVNVAMVDSIPIPPGVVVPPGTHPVGINYPRRCEINILRGLSDEAECRTVVHEYGHLVLGPGHSLDPNSVMHEPIGPFQPCDD